jgi:hypothetical protein
VNRRETDQQQHEAGDAQDSPGVQADIRLFSDRD